MGKQEFTSSWEYTKSRSNYHFDKWQDDPVAFAYQRLGTFVGDWQTELQLATENSEQTTWATRGYHSDGSPSPMLEQEEYDLALAGADPAMTIYRSSEIFDTASAFGQMSKVIGMLNSRIKYHIQYPGEVLTRHIDKLDRIEPDNPGNVKRFMIMLADWEPGHFIMYGNAYFDKWHAGEVITFDWHNMPHCTANASLVPRPLLVITGQMTEKTNQFLREGHPQRIINITNLEQ